MAIFGRKKNADNGKKINIIEFLNSVIEKLSIISEINVDKTHSLEMNVTTKQLNEVSSKLSYCIENIETEDNTTNIVSLLNDINIVLHNKINNIPFSDESLQYALIAKDQLECYIKNEIKNDIEIENKLEVIIEYMIGLKNSLQNSIELCRDSIEKSDYDMAFKIENKIKRYNLHINIIEKYIDTSKKAILSKSEINMISDKDDISSDVLINDNIEAKKEILIPTEEKSNISKKELERYYNKSKDDIDNELKLYKEKNEKEIERLKEQAEQDILKYKRELRKKFDSEILQYGNDEQRRIKGALNENADLSLQDIIESKGNTLTEEKQREEIETLKSEVNALLDSNEEYKNKEIEYENKIADLISEINDIKNSNQEEISKKIIEKTNKIDELNNKIEELNLTIEQGKADYETEKNRLLDELEGLKDNIQFYEDEAIQFDSKIEVLTNENENYLQEIDKLKNENDKNISTIKEFESNEQNYLDTIKGLETKIQQENENGKTKYLLELEDIKLKMSKDNKVLQEKIDLLDSEKKLLNEQMAALKKENEGYSDEELEYKKHIEELKGIISESESKIEHISNELNSKIMIIESKDSLIENLESTLAENDKSETVESLSEELDNTKALFENYKKEADDKIGNIMQENDKLKYQINLNKQTITIPNVLMINPYSENAIRQVDESDLKKKNSFLGIRKSKEKKALDLNYGQELIDKTKNSIKIISNCYCVNKLCLFNDGKSYFIGLANQYDGKKYNNSNGNLVKMSIFDETDIKIFTKPIDTEITDRLNSELLIRKLSSYYQFIIWFYNKNLSNTDLSVNDLIDFKKYYNEIINRIYPVIKTQYDNCTNILKEANALILLTKLFGTSYENENEMISNYINCKLHNDVNNELNANIDNILHQDIVSPELQENIQNIKNGNYKNDTDAVKPYNTEIQDVKIGITHKVDKPMSLAEKVDNVNVINFNNVKYIVKKQNSNGLIDISGYSIENIDVAINQYVYMEAYYKEIGIKYNDELVFLYGKNNNTKSVSILDERAKHINKWDKGAIGEIISFYEDKLGKLIDEYER